jgi:hypothetical protein
LDSEVASQTDARNAGAEPSYLVVDEPRRRGPLAGTSATVRAVAAVAATVVLIAGAVLVAARRDAGRVDPVVPPAASSSSGARAADGEGWSDLPASSVAPRFQHVAVSTDTGVLIWGGYGSDSLSDGAFFDSATRRWRSLPDAPLASDRGDAVGVWTGREVVLINGIDGHVRAAAFEPSAFEWRTLPDPPISNAANMMTKAVVVDGTIVVVAVSEEGEGGARNEIATFTPAGGDDDPAGAWSIGEPPPGSFGSGFDAVVVGSEVVVVARRDSGGKSCGDAVVYAYAPGGDAWRTLPSAPIANVYGPAVVSTGSELFVGGGVECGAAATAAGVPEGRAQAFLLNPVTGVWRPTSDAPAPLRGDSRYAEVWSGRFAVGRGPDGAPILYDPAADRWHVAAPTPLGEAYSEVPWIWQNGQLVLTSGGVGDEQGGCCRPLAGGYAYSPPFDWR